MIEWTGRLSSESWEKKLGTEEYVLLAETNSTVFPLLLDILEQEKSAVKYQCEKVIRAVSGKNPGVVYPYFDQMAHQLESTNHFIQWGFLLTMPSLLSVDAARRWDGILDRYLQFLDTEEIAAFANTVSCIPAVLAAYPEREAEVMQKILTVDEHLFLHKGEPSPECREVARRHVLYCLSRLYDGSAFQSEILAFARECLESPRVDVRRRAKQALTLPHQKDFLHSL